MKKTVLLFASLACLFMSGLALPQQVAAGELPHKIIAFYDPAEGGGDYFFTNLHQRAEMPLNYLGLQVVPWSIREKPPGDEALKGAAGFVTWFHRLSAFENPDEFCGYLNRQMKAGLRWLSLGYLGIYHPKTHSLSPQCRSALETLGVKDSGNTAKNPYYIEALHKDPGMVEFERKLELSEGIDYHEFNSLDPEAKVYLRLGRTDMKESRSDMVLTTRRGGFVAPTVALYFVKALDKCHWRVNPFLFFEEALGLKGSPRPDITTVNGARLLFSHIDGDGIVNVSQVDTNAYAGEVIYREILKKEPSIPVTASLITGYFDIPEYHSERIRGFYRDMFTLPHVEPSSHGYAHPLIWKKGTLALDIPDYAYQAEREILGSLQQVNEFLAAEKIPKKGNLFQWTGDCLPGFDASEVVAKSGLLNINGGDSRFDRRHDGYSWVAPIGIRRWGMRQIYTGAPNENIYTNLWQGPYYGYKDVIESFENTERPRRVKPINVYYHYYTGEKVAALNALKSVYEFIKKQDVLPVFTSEYARMAQDFFETRILSKGPDVFVVSNPGTVRTIRFDLEKKSVDMARSKGVLGFRRHNGSLYVHLDESADHEIALTGDAKGMGPPYVDYASFKIASWRGDDRKVEFIKQGWLREKLILGGVRPNKGYLVHEGSLVTRVAADDSGRLTHEFKSIENGGQGTPVMIELEPL